MPKVSVTLCDFQVVKSGMKSVVETRAWQNVNDFSIVNWLQL